MFIILTEESKDLFYSNFQVLSDYQVEYATLFSMLGWSIMKQRIYKKIWLTLSCTYNKVN